MNKHLFLSVVAGAAAVVMPLVSAHADTLMNTGDPLSGATNYTFNSSQFFADEFAITAGTTVSQLAAYLEAGTGSGTSFTFDIYQAGTTFTGNTVTRLNSNGYLVYSAAATFTGNGWNTVTLSNPWTATTTGDYWLAIETTGASTSLYVPTVAGNGATGTGALAFASETGANGGGKFVVSTSAEAGMQISTVPLPAAVWLFGSGLAGVGGLVRRRKAA